MENDEVREDIVEETTQETDNEVDNTQEETTTVEASDELEKIKAEKAELEQKNRELFARLKREEKKEIKKETKDEQIDNLDLMEFFAQGGTRDQVEALKTVMKGKGLTFAEARKDELFIALQEKIALDKRREAAKISGGNTSSSNQSGFKPGMTRDEHKAQYQKTVS
jgi:hypothetical protein